MKIIWFLLFIILIYPSYSQWEACNNGITDKGITAIASDSSIIVAGSKTGGIFYSTDFGNSWFSKTTSPTTKTIKSIMINELGIFIATLGDGIFLSTDNGDSWQNKSTGLKELKIWCLSAKANVLFAGTEKSGIFLSKDSGNTWSNRYIGVGLIWAIAQNEKSVFVSTNIGVYRSDNNGENWTMKSNGITSAWTTTIAANGNDIYVGVHNVYVSTDNGENWNNKQNGFIGSKNNTISFHSGTVLVAGSNPFFITTDKCNTWLRRNSGLSSFTVNSMVIIGDTVYAGTDGGVFRVNINDLIIGPITNIKLIIKDQSTGLPIARSDVFLSFPIGNDKWSMIDTIHKTNDSGIVQLDFESQEGPLLLTVYDTNYLTFTKVLTINELRTLKTVELVPLMLMKDFVTQFEGVKKDYCMIQCPVVVTVQDGMKSRFGIDTSGNIIGKMAGAEMYFTKLGEPVIIILPEKCEYSYHLQGLDSGSFQFDIWKSFTNGNLHLIYKSTINRLTIGDITLKCDIHQEVFTLNIDYNNDGVSDSALLPTESNFIYNEQFFLNSLNILSYPNPATDFIEISIPESDHTLKGAAEEIRIYDVFGELVNLTKSQDYPTPTLPEGRELRIDVSALPAGLYFVRVGGRVGKFVKL